MCFNSLIIIKPLKKGNIYDSTNNLKNSRISYLVKGIFLIIEKIEVGF